MKVFALRTAIIAACAAAGYALTVAPAFAQAFPVKPITMICPWPPGGSTDQHLRAFAQIASKYVGQNIVLENRPGAGGMLGPGNMAKLAQPDGYTISQLPVGAFRIPHMQKVDWDPLKDFTYSVGGPVAEAGDRPGVHARGADPDPRRTDRVDRRRGGGGALRSAGGAKCHCRWSCRRTCPD